MRHGLLALLCAAVFAGLTAFPVLAVRDVAIVGASSVEVAAVREAAALDGQNPFTVSAVEAAVRVRQLPSVHDARVSVGLPDRAAVEVTERVALLVVGFAGGWLYADGSGVLFSGDDPRREPLLEDETRTYRPGDRVPAGVVGAVREVASAQTGFFGSGLARSRLTAAYGLVFVLDRGTEVRVGTTEQLDRKKELARRILLERSGRRLDYVDVRSPDRVVFFPQD
jgi:cell division septal protein FtsQ